ncbi:MAG TPA: NADH-quinone oxidoreductase subunit N [Nitrospirota bacterium]|nr:NADH-quinone oxidoreductase subunit N [Nitrospirota bacterium]
MNTGFSLHDLAPLLPELILAAAASVLLVLELVLGKKAVLGLIGIAASAAAFAGLSMSGGAAFNGMFVSDPYSSQFKVIFLITAVLTILISLAYLPRKKAEQGEYYSLVLFATLGMMLMASARDLIVMYLGLELMALSTYILAGIMRHDRKSNEAALKYFLLGAFSSAVLLFGISLTYGTTTTTDLATIAARASASGPNPVALLGMGLMATAFCFKIAAAPFHMWAPDVYEGAPTSITAFMSVGPKAAGFAVLGRVFFIAFPGLQAEWTAILTVIAILSMAVGNILALVQTNIKRMLAYSSIAHAGYMLIGVIVGTNEGLSAILTYLLIYAFMNMGAFAVVILLEKGDTLQDYEGLAKSNPLAAAAMLVFMFSLTGIPPTAGFIGKFNLFLIAVNAGYAWLVVVAVIFSAISAYYYLRVVRNMYMKDRTEAARTHPAFSLGLALGIAVAMIFVIGIMPSVVLGR